MPECFHGSGEGSVQDPVVTAECKPHRPRSFALLGQPRLPGRTARVLALHTGPSRPCGPGRYQAGRAGAVCSRERGLSRMTRPPQRRKGLARIERSGS